MHKYHMADVLTLFEFIMAGVMILFAIYGVDAGLAFIVFAVGEVCDAFDGICARKWHYPNDGKKRWWRIHASLLDQLSDIALGLATLCYTIFWTNTTLALIVTAMALGIAIPIQIIVNDMERKIRRYKLSRAREILDSLVLMRRHLYIFGIVAVGLLMIYYSPWSPLVREVVLAVGVGFGIVLWFVKQDRWTQNKTPL